MRRNNLFLNEKISDESGVNVRHNGRSFISVALSVCECLFSDETHLMINMLCMTQSKTKKKNIFT